MKKLILVITSAAFTVVTIVSSQAQTSDTTKAFSPKDSVLNNGLKDSIKSTSKMVGGANMLASDDIVENASKSKDHTKLISAIKKAGLTDTLKGNGPFTVFAPTNEAFSKLPAGTLDSLNLLANKDELVDLLTYHVVAGKLTSRDLALAVARADGKATITTVEGDELTISINESKNLQITDSKGNVALVTMFDVEQSNGVVHVINNVLLPKE